MITAKPNPTVMTCKMGAVGRTTSLTSAPRIAAYRLMSPGCQGDPLHLSTNITPHIHHTHQHCGLLLLSHTSMRQRKGGKVRYTLDTFHPLIHPLLTVLFRNTAWIGHQPIRHITIQTNGCSFSRIVSHPCQLLLDISS